MTDRLVRPALRRALCGLLGALPLVLASAPAGAAVVISQVYGGGGNSGATLRHDFIELFNNGAASVDVSNWAVQYAAAAGPTGTNPWAVTALPVGTTLAAGRYLLVRQAAGSGGTVDVVGDVPNGTIAMGGASGKVALTSNSTALTGVAPSGGAVVDIVSYGAATPTEGSPTPQLSNTTAALRNANGCTDTNNNSADFTVAAPAPRSSATAAVACSGDGGGGTPPVAAAARIFAIQGSGGTSPLAGQTVRSTGVVTLLLNNGFFMQDVTGDNDPATSDGLFVFTGATRYPAAAVGNLVEATGTVVEFNTGAAGNADTSARPVTELSNVTSVSLAGSGSVPTPIAVTLPETVDGDLERYEGMLVTLTGPLTIAQNFFQGRYGQLTLAVGGRLETPTNRLRPGSQANALADENARRRILLDDGSTLQNPNPTPYLDAEALPRAGDRVASITGVIDYGLATNSNTGLGDYKIHPTVAPVFSTANPRTAAPEPVGGNVKVASFNVLNFFTTFTDGSTATGQTGQGCSLGGSTSAANCRGAGNAVEFGRQRDKIVAAMSAIDADVLGLMELQNNGNTAAQNLVDALNAAVGPGTYAVTAVPSNTGTDAIRVALLYKPARLTPVGAPLSDADAVNNRPTLAQTFVLANGERFSVLVNHLKSKGSCPAPGDADFAGNDDSGDGQGCWNALRLQQAQRLRAFVAQVQAQAGSTDALLIGDFNAYAQEDPIVDLTSNGYVDQIARFNAGGYSYVFDGAAGRLDHAITTASLSARTSGTAHWHINADETPLADYNQEFKAPATTCGGLCPADPYRRTPYRSSDHDPVVVGLGLYKTITAASNSTTVVGSAGDDIVQSGAGRRALTGGTGRDQFVFTSGFVGGATITDFESGIDSISLRALMQSLRITSANPIASGHVSCGAVGADAQIHVDPDAAGPAAMRPVLLLKGQTCAVLTLAHFTF